MYRFEYGDGQDRMDVMVELLGKSREQEQTKKRTIKIVRINPGNMNTHVFEGMTTELDANQLNLLKSI